MQVQYRVLHQVGAKIKLSHHARIPGINFDEVEFHRVCASRQVERLLYFRVLTFGIKTTTNLAQSATCGNLAAVPAFEILQIIEAIALLAGSRQNN